MVLRTPYREPTATEILSKSLNLYLAKYELFIIPFLAANLANNMLSQLMYSLMPEFLLPPDFTEEFLLWLINYLANAVPVIAIFAIINWAITTISNGIAVKCSSDMLNEKSPSLRTGLNSALSSILPLLAAGLIVGVLTVLGMILLIIPGIIAAVMFSLTVQVIMLEQLGVFTSLRRSRELVAGRWAKTFAVLLLVLLGTAVASLAGEVLVSSLGGLSGGAAETARWLITSILMSLVQPLQPIALTYLYYTLRMRERAPKPAIPTSAQAPARPPAARPTGPSLRGYRPRFCYKCGQRLPSDAIYCPRCGIHTRP